MGPLHVLIVEDEPLVSLLLEEIVENTVPAVVTVSSSIAEAMKALDNPIDLALLDIEVTNGKTHDIARSLVGKHVPFVFVSGSLRANLPPELQDIPFIAKPFVHSEIRDVVLLIEDARSAESH